MSNNQEIKTETQFILSVLKHIIQFPWILLMVAFGKKEPSELLNIYHEFTHFFKDAKVTYYLIIANVVIFLIEVFILIPYWHLDYFVSSPENFYTYNFISMFSHMFLHASLMHLFGNMIFLFVFGRVTEKYLGTKQMLLVYFGAGIISHLISAGIFLNTGIGASGAISGLVAAAILIRPFYLSYVLLGFPMPIFILGILQMFGDFTGFLYPDPSSNVGHIAHLAGYASIMITVFLLNPEQREEMKKGLNVNLLMIILFIILNVMY